MSECLSRGTAALSLAWSGHRPEAWHFRLGSPGGRLVLARWGGARASPTASEAAGPEALSLLGPQELPGITSLASVIIRTV